MNLGEACLKNVKRVYDLRLLSEPMTGLEQKQLEPILRYLCQMKKELNPGLACAQDKTIIIRRKLTQHVK